MVLWVINLYHWVVDCALSQFKTLVEYFGQRIDQQEHLTVQQGYTTCFLGGTLSEGASNSSFPAPQITMSFISGKQLNYAQMEPYFGYSFCAYKSNSKEQDMGPVKENAFPFMLNTSVFTYLN